MLITTVAREEFTKFSNFVEFTVLKMSTNEQSSFSVEIEINF